MNVEPLISPDAFVGLEGVSHLCTGGEGPWLKAQHEVYEEFTKLKGESHTGRATIYERGDRCRDRVGTLWAFRIEGLRLCRLRQKAWGGSPEVSIGATATMW